MSGPSWWAMLPRRSSASGSVSASLYAGHQRAGHRRRPLLCKRPFADLRPLWLAVRHPRGMLHFTLVTSVPLLHGGFCLYNGGFTRRSCACSSSRSSSTSSARRRAQAGEGRAHGKFPIMLTAARDNPSGLYHWGVVGERRPRRPVPHCRLVPAAVKTARTNCVCSGGQ